MTKKFCYTKKGRGISLDVRRNISPLSEVPPAGFSLLLKRTSGTFSISGSGMLRRGQRIPALISRISLP